MKSARARAHVPCCVCGKGWNLALERVVHIDNVGVADAAEDVPLHLGALQIVLHICAVVCEHVLACVRARTQTHGRAHTSTRVTRKVKQALTTFTLRFHFYREDV